MSDSKKQDPFLLSSKCWLRSISSLIHLIVSRRATGSGMAVSYQYLRHIRPLWPVSLVVLAPAGTNHQTIKAEHLGTQNNLVKVRADFLVPVIITYIWSWCPGMVLGFVCIRDRLSTFRPLLCPREDRVSCRSHLSSILKPVGILPDLFGRPCHVPWTRQWGSRV